MYPSSIPPETAAMGATVQVATVVIALPGFSYCYCVKQLEER
jgi:hypothetical protein